MGNVDADKKFWDMNREAYKMIQEIWDTESKGATKEEVQNPNNSNSQTGGR